MDCNGWLAWLVVPPYYVTEAKKIVKAFIKNNKTELLYVV